MQFDTNLVLWLNSLAGKNSVLDEAIIFFGEYFIYSILIGVFFAGYILYRRKKQLAVLFPFASAGLAAILAYFPVAFVIKNITARPRPFMILSLHQLIQDNSFAFPSGHTIFLFALGTMIFSYHKKIGSLILVGGCLVGTARIAAGVHYPTDIIGGAMIGMMIGSGVNILHKNLLAKYYTGLFATKKHS